MMEFIGISTISRQPKQIAKKWDPIWYQFIQKRKMIWFMVGYEFEHERLDLPDFKLTVSKN